MEKAGGRGRFAHSKDAGVVMEVTRGGMKVGRLSMRIKVTQKKEACSGLSSWWNSTWTESFDGRGEKSSLDRGAATSLGGGGLL